jgi:hypothetical protein
MATMTLVLQRQGAKPDLVPLNRYGGKVRVSWGEMGRRAGIWNIVANPNGEVYIMERNTGGFLKVSLHKSGEWRYQWVRDNAEKNSLVKAVIESKGSRIIDRWNRPVALEGETVTPAYTIFTSGQDITFVQDDESIEDKVCWLPPPEEDETAFFSIFFLRPTGTAIEFKGGYVPINAFALKTGEALLLAAARRKMKDDERAQLIKYRELLANARDYVSQNVPSAGPNLRALLPRHNEDGNRYILDLSMHSTLSGD